MDTNRFVQGTPIHPADPNAFLFTDASHYGWGAHLELMRLSFHGRWSEDQSQLHINMLEIMAIRLALKKTMEYIHHSCVMISNDNTTVVSYINKQEGTHSPNLCVEVWVILHWCMEHDVMIRVTYSRQIQYFGRLSLENGQTSQNRMGIGSVNCEFHFPNAQLPQCRSVCDMIQSQTPIVCISSSGQSGLSGRRIINELESSSCISSNNSGALCSSRDMSVSVQNSSYCSPLAPTSVVLRGITTGSISSNSSSALSKTSDTVNKPASVAQLDTPSRLETRRSRVQPWPRSATFFRGD